MHCVRCMASGPKPNIEPSRVQSCSSFTTILSLCTTNLTYLPFSPLTPQKFRTCHPRPRVVFGQLNRESKLTPCRLIFRVRSPHFSFLTTPPTSVALQETQTSLPPQVFDQYTLCAPLSNVLKNSHLPTRIFPPRAPFSKCITSFSRAVKETSRYPSFPAANRCQLTAHSTTAPPG